MKRRIWALVTALCLALSLAPTAWAEEKDVSISGLGDADGEYTFDEAKPYLLENALLSEGNYTITLLGDREVILSDSDSELSGAAMLMMGGEDPAVATFDLGGHTLTIKNESGNQGVGILTIGGKSLVQNGTVVLAGDDLCGICGGDGTLWVENVTIQAENDIENAIGIVNNPDVGDLNITIVSNCTIALGEGNTSLVCGNSNEDQTYDLFVKSGSFDTFPTGDDATFISLFDENSEKMSEEDTAKLGVRGTVVTSADTTAIIVKDGSAYLYDSLQEAVDAAEGKQDGTGNAVQISLLKQPGDTKVVLPDGVELTIKPLNDADGSIKTEEIPLETSDGKKAEIGTNGEVTVQTVPVQNVTLDKSTLTLTAGDSATLTATVLPEDAANKNTTWSSSDPSVATVDDSGKVAAVAVGTTVITVTTVDGGRTAS